MNPNQDPAFWGPAGAHLVRYGAQWASAFT
jgi:hypothetical protein